MMAYVLHHVLSAFMSALWPVSHQKFNKMHSINCSSQHNALTDMQRHVPTESNGFTRQAIGFKYYLRSDIILACVHLCNYICDDEWSSRQARAQMTKRNLRVLLALLLTFKFVASLYDEQSLNPLDGTFAATIEVHTVNGTSDSPKHVLIPPEAEVMFEIGKGGLREVSSYTYCSTLFTLIATCGLHVNYSATVNVNGTTRRYCLATPSAFLTILKKYFVDVQVVRLGLK